jgi:hypothetical protein
MQDKMQQGDELSVELHPVNNESHKEDENEQTKED